jgi:glycosyltransferase involved in cell wall biosynthesis
VRIALVNTRADAVGGSQVHVRDLAAELIARGHEARVFIGGTGPVLDFLAKANVPYTSIASMQRNVQPMRDLKAFKELKAAIAAFDPDLISTHTSKAGMLGRLVSRDLGIPSLFTAHGWNFAEGVHPLARAGRIQLEKLAAHWCERIITVSECDRQLALQFRVAPVDKVITIHNGMPELKSADLRANPANQPARIVMIARFEQQKDHETLLAALGALKHLPWQLELIGDGPNAAKIKARIAELGIAARVELPGACNDVSNRLARAQIFALISNWEGLPRSIIEAMRAGLPVVASDVGGVRELVDDGRTGFMVSRSDAKALEFKLGQLISNPEMRLQMGHLSRLRYEQQFTFERMVEKTFGIYEEIISSVPNRNRRDASPRQRVVHVVESFAAGTAAVVTEMTRSMPEYQHVIVHGSRENSVVPQAALLGVGTQLIPWRGARRELSVLGDLLALIELVRLLRRQPRVDVLHGHSSKGGAHARIAAILLGLSSRTIYTTHGSPVLREDVGRFGRALFIAAEWLLSKTRATVVACSQSELESLKSLCIAGRLVTNGVRSPEYPALEKTSRTGDRMRVGTVGRIVAQKDPAFMSGICALAGDDRVFDLVWIGSGELESKLDPDIERTGWLTEQQVAAQVAGLDVYVSTSRWEGLSLSVLQAMFMGKPLVLRRCVGNVDAVVEGENGFLFDDPAGAAKCLSQLAGDPALRRAMGRRSRELALVRFGSDRMIEDYRRLYQQRAAVAVQASSGGVRAGPDGSRRPRILLVLEASAGGAGRHVLDLAEGLVSQGCAVHLLYADRRIDRMFAERVKAIEGLQSQIIRVDRHINANDFTAVLQTRRYIRDHGPFDIIHGHSAKGGALARLAAIGSGAAVFYTPHGFQLMDPGLSRIKRFCYAAVELVLSCTRGQIIVVSPEERNAVARLGISPDRVTLIPNGIRLDAQIATRAKARRTMGLDDEAMIIGFVGRLVQLKAVDVLLRAFALTAAAVPSARLAIVGSGPLLESLQALADDLNIAAKVVWLGEQNARGFVRGFDVFTLASRKEGLPYVILEAMAAGLPVVATDTCSVSVLLKHRENGMVVPRDDVQKFADALIELGSNPRLRLRQGEAARARAGEFTIADMVKNTLDAYRRATGANLPEQPKPLKTFPVAGRAAA